MNTKILIALTITGLLNKQHVPNSQDFLIKKLSFSDVQIQRKVIKDNKYIKNMYNNPFELEDTVRVASNISKNEFENYLEIERERKEREKKKRELEEFHRVYEEVTIGCTFYTNLPEENGGYIVTCEGKSLQEGMVANNVLKLNTEILVERLDKIGLYGHKKLIVSDRGGSNFNGRNRNYWRLDVYVPRNCGESRVEYFKRVNNMGKVNLKAYIKRSDLDKALFY